MSEQNKYLNDVLVMRQTLKELYPEAARVLGDGFELKDGVIWMYDDHDSEIAWNTKGNKEDLINGDGDTYGSYVPYIAYEDDEFFLVEADHGGLLFLKSERIEWEDSDE